MRRLRPSLLLALVCFAGAGWAALGFSRAFLRQFCTASLGLGH